MGEAGNENWRRIEEGVKSAEMHRRRKEGLPLQYEEYIRRLAQDSRGTPLHYYEFNDATRR